MNVRIGTRGSPLALWQANETARLLRGAGYDSEIAIVKTTGDKRHDVSLATIGGKGLFVKELEEALQRGAIDVAVHSLKDVPSIIPDPFVLAGFLERADPRDAWLHVEGRPIAGLPEGSIVGTSAPRRRAQLLRLFPHLRAEDIRGNVDTRIQKARDGRYAGIILARAGLTRLGRADQITSTFSVDEMVPAAGQGIVAIECLASNQRAQEAARAITHEPSAVAARAERGVLQKFGTRLDCYSAVAVHCTVETAESPWSGGLLAHRALGRSLPRARQAGSPPLHRMSAPPLLIRAFFSDGIRAIHARGASVDEVYEDLMAQGAEALL